MPKTEWSGLTSLQRGKYAEYYAKMEFTSYKYEVYDSEVDDHGVDFVAKDPDTGIFFEVQVKSLCKEKNSSYVFIQKDKIATDDMHLVCFIYFEDGKMPSVYLFPASVWNNLNDLFVSHDYGKPGQKSKPEWGINYSRKNMPLMDPYRIENYFKDTD